MKGWRYDILFTNQILQSTSIYRWWRNSCAGLSSNRRKGQMKLFRIFIIVISPVHLFYLVKHFPTLRLQFANILSWLCKHNIIQFISLQWEDTGCWIKETWWADMGYSSGTAAFWEIISIKWMCHYDMIITSNENTRPTGHCNKCIHI